VHWIKNYPQKARFVHRDGCLYLRLNKFVYGLQESSAEFSGLLKRTLLSMGFYQSRADACQFFKKTKSGLMVISAHVDDLLLTSPNPMEQRRFESELKKHFEIVVHHDDLSYIGMHIARDRRKRTTKVTQHGFIKDLIEKYPDFSKAPKTPANDDVFTIDKSSPKCDKKEYLSLVMSLMYPARLTRPDILAPVTILATRSENPTISDFSKLLRILAYLSESVDVGLIYDGKIPLDPKIYADASHGVHPDARGHAGIVITLGSAPIFCRSYKIKAVTRSSTESELYALEEASTYSVWLRLLLKEFGLPIKGPIPTFQDNKSTIIIAIQGGNFKRTKHLLLREEFVRERIENGDIALKYLKTQDMPADMLTKPLGKTPLQKHMQSLSVSI
jgi:hypothetical protein